MTSELHVRIERLCLPRGHAQVDARALEGLLADHLEDALRRPRHAAAARAPREDALAKALAREVLLAVRRRLPPGATGADR